MIRRALLSLFTVSMLAGCGTGMPGVTQTFEMPEFTLAPGWSAALAASRDLPRASSLLVRKAGGYVLAYDTVKLGGKDVFVTTSPDGKTWSPAVVVGQTRFTEESPTLWEDDQGKIHLIYASNDSGSFQLYASASRDGKTWDEPVAITDEIEHAKAPSVTRTPNGVAIAYQTLGGALEVMQSSDGEVWGLSRRIELSGGDPAICHDGEGLRVVFHRNETLYERVERNGAWSEATQIPGAAPMREPAIAMIAGTVTLAYSTLGPNGNWKVALRVAQPSGWGLEQELVQGPDDHGFPSLAEGKDGGSWLAWGINRLTEERGIFVARSGGR